MKILKINPQVYDDLNEIRNFIEKDSEPAAEKVIAKVLDSLQNLQTFPEMGAKLQNKVKQKTRYRFLSVYSYVVFYYLDGEFVIVSRVLHSSRDNLHLMGLDK